MKKAMLQRFSYWRGRFPSNGARAFGIAALALFAIFAFAASSRAQPGTPPEFIPGVPAPLSYWSFDETSGTVAHDPFGNVNGTLEGSVAFVPGGVEGNAVSISGSGSFVNMGDNFNFNNSSAYSLQVWVKLAAGDQNGYIPVSRHHSTVVEGYFIAIGNILDGCSNIPGSVHLYSEYPCSPNSSILVNDGNWHQLVGTFQGGVASIYVDGTFQGSSSGTTLNPLDDYPFLVGGFNSPQGVPTNTYSGLIDDVGVWNTALTANEIAILYQSVSSSPLAFTTIDVPGASGTFAQGINDAGQIVGWYTYPPADQDGHEARNIFVLSNGSFSTFAYPGSGGYYSTAYGINNTGQIVGFCETEFYGTLGPCQDFYGVPDGWVESGESYARVSFPGAISYTTDAIGINDQGQVTGEYELPSGAVYGYLLSGGSYTTINPSNSSGSGAYGINNAGDIVGYYCTNSNCTIAGFLQSGGNTTTITVPGATSTTAWGVNNSDDVVGYYTNASGVYGGFLWQEGQFTLLSDPLGVQTYATGINDAGQIVGYYQDGNGVLHGFVTAPAGATAATVTLGSLNQTYTGSPLSATATTTPVGLAVTFTYNGSATPPTAAGSYTVVGTINSPGYQGSATGTLVIAKATATVTLGSLNQTYTGSPLSASATTSPGGLTVIFTYNGSPTAPTAVGSYTVVGTINDPNYQGSASGTLIIAAPIPCPLSLSAPGESFSTEGGVGSFSVTPGPSCTWSAKSNVSWISVLSLPIIPLGFEVISPANVIYEVSANSGAARSGTISVGAQTYSITQAGFSCSYSIGPTFAATADTGGSVAVSVSAPAGCSWRATANVPWMTVKSGASGSGGGVVVLSVSANTGASRSGTATIAGQTFTVTEGSGDCGALDVGSKASVSASQLIQFPYFGLNPENLNEYSQTITVRNNSYSPIPGPVYVVLLGEPHNNPFNNDSDLLGTFLTTTCFSSQPSYLLNMPLPASGTLPPGQTSEYPVTWVTEESGTVVYSTKVLSGKPSH